MPREAYVYILTNRYHTVLYTGVTCDIHRRMYEHSQEAAASSSSFTALYYGRYNVSKLIYIKRYLATEDAIRGEK